MVPGLPQHQNRFDEKSLWSAVWGWQGDGEHLLSLSKGIGTIWGCWLQQSPTSLMRWWFVGREMDSNTSVPPAFPNGSLFSSTWGSCIACSLSVRRRSSIRYPDCQSIMRRTSSGAIAMSWSSAFAKEGKHCWWIEAVQEWVQRWSSFRWYWRLSLPLCTRSLWNQDHSMTWIAYGCEVAHRRLNALRSQQKHIEKIAHKIRILNYSQKYEQRRIQNS